MPGPAELLIILLIVLLIFGAGKLPGIGDALGKSIKNFKRSAQGEDEIEVSKRPAVGAGRKAGELEGGSVDDEDYADVVARKAKKKAPVDD